MLSMEVPAEEFVESSNDQTVVMRGKRTKRHRPASPFGLAMTCSSSSGGGGDLYCGSASSPTTSDGEVYESTEEEEDMANCLILLAQGGVANSTTQQVTTAHQERCSSRKFTEIMATTAVKVGFYVYECKTCNRTFPSFQALGGHRASHKKSKTAPAPEIVTVVEEKRAAVSASHIPIAIPIAQSSAVTVDHRQLDDVKLARNCHSPPLSLQFGNHGTTTTAVNSKASFNNNSKSNKTHECSICGSEFTSGQALGGHMRRHRTAAVASATTPATHQPRITADTSAVDHHQHRHEEEKKGRNILQLDLNLPAPEDEPPSTAPPKFQFSSVKQSIVFSAPALVDCHY